jgi:Type II secretion system (T2SS), protein F
MAPSWLLGLAWGTLLALPIVRRARRVAPAARIAALAPPSDRTPRRAGFVAGIRAKATHRSGPVRRVLGALHARRRARVDHDALARALPVVVDLLGVAVGAGCTPYLAVEVAANWSPAMVAAPLAGVLRSCALGMGFASALDATARATPALRPLAEALLASDRSGAPVAPTLARLADEERTALRRRAEAHARRIPVRLLFPLVFLVLPAFVLLTVIPGLASGLGRL